MSAHEVEVLTVDVAVIGAGPAGIAAAARIGESGRRAALLDESPAVGGQIWRHRRGTPPPAVARRWIARLDRSGATILTGTSVVDICAAGDAGGFVVAAERGASPCVIHAASLVLATGARERFLPFPGWTLPGVIGVGGAQALLKAGAPFSGKRVVIAGSGPLLLPVAAALAHGGARVELVAEQASRRAVGGFALGLWRRPASLAQAARYRAGFLRTPYRTGTWVTAARGDGRVEEVTVTDGRVSRTIACDTLCAAFGLVPNTQFARLLGCEVANGAVVVDAGQRTSVQGVHAAGEATGIGGVDLAIVEGEIAALCATGREGDARRLQRRRVALLSTAGAMERAFAPRAELRALSVSATIVCRCEDVTLGAMRSDWTMRQAKLYTRAGMGACQGRVCGPALEFLFGWPADSVRLPVEPALLSTIRADEAEQARRPQPQGAFR